MIKSPTMRIILFTVGLLLCLLPPFGPARAAETPPPSVSAISGSLLTLAPVTPKLVCSAQHAIRWQTSAWRPAMCLRVANAVNAAAKATGTHADELLAIAINESDLRSGAQHWHHTLTLLPGGKYRVTAIEPGAVGDLGLMGTRCVLDKRMRCGNGLLRGWKYPAAMQIENNVMLGARILASAGRRGYNAGAEYWPHIEAIRAALRGEIRKTTDPRVRKLILQIATAIQKDYVS